MRVHVVTIIFFVWKFFDFVGLGAATTRHLWKKRNNKRAWGFSDTICVVTLTEASPHWSNGYGHPSMEPPTHTLNLILLLIFKRTREGRVSLGWFHCFQARSRQCFCIAYFAKIELKSDKKKTPGQCLLTYESSSISAAWSGSDETVLDKKRLVGISDTSFVVALIEPPPHWIKSEAHISIEPPTHSRKFAFGVNLYTNIKRSCVASLIPLFSDAKLTVFLHSLFRENRPKIR